MAFYSVADFPRDKEPDRYVLFLVCGNCQGGLVAEVNGIGSPHEKRSNLIDCGYRLLQAYPEVPPVGVPRHVPDNIARFYLQAAESLRGKHFDACGAMCRKVLDIATQDISFESIRRLRDRIDRLAADHQITPAMQDWAHIIRLDGNEAVHEDKFEEPTATDLFSFTELFLMYAFTLPGMIEERRLRKAT